MPMGVVSNDEFEKEISNSGIRKDRVIEGVVENDIKPGRKPGDNNVPESLRKIIGETSELEGRQEALAIAKMFGVSDSSVSAYAKGATSTASYNTPDTKIADYIRQRKNLVTKKSLRVLQSSIGLLTREALAQEKPRNIAAIAKDMSAIIKNMEPDEKGPEVGDNNQFIFYSPQFVNEEHYETVIVNE